MKNKENNKVTIELEDLGYLYSIDKSDYDIVNILSKEKLSKDELKDIIIKNFKDYDIEIQVDEYRCYYSDFLGESKDINFVFNYKTFKFQNNKSLKHDLIAIEDSYEYNVLKKSILLNTDSYELELEITSENELEYLQRIFYEYSDELFGYNSGVYINQRNLERIEKIIKRIKEIQEHDK